MTKCIWVSSNIKFDTIRFDTSSYFLYGGGSHLKFDSTKTFKSFSNDFYLVNDSISWGEPLANFKSGTWISENTKIISSSIYIDGSAMELLGKKQTDTFYMKGDTLVCNTLEKFIPVRLLSKELNEVFIREWPSYYKKENK